MSAEFSSSNVPRFLGVDHLEFAVADIDRAAEVHHRLGFVRIAARELRERRVKSYRLASGNFSVVLSQSQNAKDPIAMSVAKHGDGIFAIGFLCQDALTALERLHQRGGQVVEAPRTVQLNESTQTQTQAQVCAFAEVRHTVVSRAGGPFLEGFPPMPPTAPVGFGIERVVGWCAYLDAPDFLAAAAHYETMLGLTRAPVDAGHDHQRNWVTADGRLFPSMCTTSPERDVVRDFLGVNHGAGVGEVTLHAANLESTLAKIRAAGLKVDEGTGVTEPIAGLLRYRIVATETQA